MITAKRKFVFPVSEGIELLGEYGLPNIPIFTEAVLIPYGHKVTDIQVTLSQKEVIENIFIKAALEDVPLLENIKEKPYWENAKIYNNDAYFPYKFYENAGIQYKNGYAIQLISLYPYQFNPVKKELVFYREITINIKTKPDNEIRDKEQRFLVKSKNTEKYLKKFVSNFKDISTYKKEPVVIKQHRNSIVSADDPYEKIIITSAAYRDNPDFGIQEYAAEVGAKVFTREEIYTNYNFLELHFLDYNYPPSLDNAMRIRNFLIDAYHVYGTTETPLRWLLILGDRGIIPSRNFPMIYDGVYRTLWGDIYYSNLGGNGFFKDDQDLHNNGRKDYGWSRSYSAGHPDDTYNHNFDLFCDIEVGRFCGATAEQFSNFFDKCRKYETAKPQDSDIGLHVAQHNSVCMCSRLTGIGKFDSFVTDGYNYEQRCYCTTGYRERNIMPEYQKGYNLIANKSHAISWNSVTANWEDMLSNDYAGILYNEACSLVPLTSGIRTSLMVSSPYAFTCIIGNSNYGWVGTSPYFTNRLSEVFFNNNPLTVGELFHQHKDLEIARRTIGSTYSRWVYWNINLMGAPWLKIKKQGENDMEILGVNIFRDNVKINTNLITGNEYIDNNVVNGTTYLYKLELVTSEGSKFSNEVSVTPYDLPDINLEATAKYGAVELNWTIS